MRRRKQKEKLILIMQLNKLTISDRTNLMYQHLRKLDQLKNTQIDQSWLYLGADGVNDLILDLITGMQGELTTLKKYEKPRERTDPAGELTTEILNQFHYGATCFALIEELANDKEFTEEIRYKSLLKQLQRLEKIAEKFTLMINNFDQTGDINESIEIDND